MATTTPRAMHSTDNEEPEVQRLQRRILSRFLFVFSAPLVIILALTVVSYKLNQKVQKIALLQDSILQELDYAHNKAYTQIINGYEKLKTQGFSSPRVETRLASLYFQRNASTDREHALQLLDAAKQSSPQAWEIYHTLCALYTTLDKEKEALENCEESIRLAPDGPQAYNNAAWIYVTSKNREINNIDKALRYAEKAVKLTARQSASNLDTLAEVYFQKGEGHTALKTIDEARALVDTQQAYYAKRQEKFQLTQSR